MANQVTTGVPELQSKNMAHIQSVYDHCYIWLIIGAFASQCNKQVRIFTDGPEQF